MSLFQKTQGDGGGNTTEVLIEGPVVYAATNSARNNQAIPVIHNVFHAGKNIHNQFTRTSSTQSSGNGIGVGSGTSRSTSTPISSSSTTVYQGGFATRSGDAVSHNNGNAYGVYDEPDQFKVQILS